MCEDLLVCCVKVLFFFDVVFLFCLLDIGVGDVVARNDGRVEILGLTKTRRSSL